MSSQNSDQININNIEVAKSSRYSYKERQSFIGCRCETYGKDYCMSGRHVGDLIDYEKEKNIFLDSVISLYKEYVTNIDGWDGIMSRDGFDHHEHLIQLRDRVDQVTEV